MSIIKTIYNYSPVIIQNLACTLRGIHEKNIRLGGEFDEIYNFLQESQWWSFDDIRDYQVEELQKLIEYSYNHIPYYFDLFNSTKLKPSDIKRLDDIQKIPVLTKELVRGNYEKLINLDLKRKSIHAHTSGSTGKSLNFLLTKRAIQYRWAIWFRHKSRFSIKVDDPYATFTGQVAVPMAQNKPPYWRENYAMRQTVFTMHHINHEKIESIVNRLNKGGFAYYTGYPSILFSLASLIEELGMKITSPPKIIFTGAEALLANQREKISKVFGCVVTDQYGFTEGAGNASRCENDLFHEDFEYGILECYNPIVNKDGSKTGKVLATGFTNMVMPFIRYEIGDTATWIENNCPCGRYSSTIREISGRNEDFIVTPEGNKILRFDYIFKDTANIFEAQVIQKELGSIIIKIVKRQGYSVKDENFLIKEISSKVSPALKVYFEYVSEIEKETTGKYRAVKSYLK
ncbi:capsular polysaccharide biosynthesis protein [Spirochaetia bacterium]|nr:capsular polysaccharide biosynthesis protein [Spirochaetia bacterium]